MNERESAMKYLFNKCATKYNDKNIKKIKPNCSDRGNENTSLKEYSMCFNKNFSEFEDYCGPDWTFYNWPSANIQSFMNITKKIAETGNEKYIIDKIGWYGNIFSPLQDVIENKTRVLLKNIGDSNKDKFDIIHMSPENGKINEKINNYIPMYDLTKYKFLIDIGGNGYSGRLKYLLFAKRPILLVDRVYIEYFHILLEPYVHYIPIKQDLSDIYDVLDWIDNNYDECIKIANNAYNFAVENFTEEKILERIFYVYNNLKAL